MIIELLNCANERVTSDGTRAKELISHQHETEHETAVSPKMW